MPLYEHVFISRQDLSSAQAEGLVEHFSTVLSDNGGKIVESEYWGVKTMAYKINKNRKGHYAFLKTDAPSAAVQEMERLMRLHDDVMRILTIKVDAHGEGPSVQMQKRDERDRGDRAAARCRLGGATNEHVGVQVEQAGRSQILARLHVVHAADDQIPCGGVDVEQVVAGDDLAERADLLAIDRGYLRLGKPGLQQLGDVGGRCGSRNADHHREGSETGLG